MQHSAKKNQEKVPKNSKSDRKNSDEDLQNVEFGKVQRSVNLVHLGKVMLKISIWTQKSAENTPSKVITSRGFLVGRGEGFMIKSAWGRMECQNICCITADLKV